MSTLLSKLKGRRFGAVLSSGFFGFYGHAGFVEALRDAQLEPAAWTGTSAGGMVAAFAASGMSATKLKNELLKARREDFWDLDLLGIARDVLKRGKSTTGLLKGDRFQALLRSLLPVSTFEQCAPLMLVTTNLTTQSPLVIDSGDLPSAVHATCAYPGLFQAVRREGQLLWDGGIVDKAPLLALADHPHGKKLDALLVHFLPSRDATTEPSGAAAWPSGMAAGMGALRKDHFRLQLEVLKARGVDVYVVTSHLPAVGPRTMAVGAKAFEAGRASLQAALHAPPAGWLGSD